MGAAWQAPPGARPNRDSAPQAWSGAGPSQARGIRVGRETRPVTDGPEEWPPRPPGLLGGRHRTRLTGCLVFFPILHTLRLLWIYLPSSLYVLLMVDLPYL